MKAARDRRPAQGFHSRLQGAGSSRRTSGGRRSMKVRGDGGSGSGSGLAPLKAATPDDGAQRDFSEYAKFSSATFLNATSVQPRSIRVLILPRPFLSLRFTSPLRRF